MNTLDAMQTFVRVAELASFTKAADSLGMPKASMSSAVSRLEAELGTQLLHRTTRKVQMTQDGLTFYERAKDLLADIDELQSMFQSGSRALRGRLRVDMPGSLARLFVIPRLPEFLHEHPQLDIEIGSTDRIVDLVREGFDCVLRVGALADSSLIARPLGRLAMLNCVSPSYIETYGTPLTLDDLSRHRLVHYVRTLGAKPDGFEYFDGSAYCTLAMAGTVTVNSVEGYDASCRAGFGIIQAPAIGTRHLIEQGVLVEVLPQYRAEPMPVSLVYAQRRNLPRRVQAFMAWIAQTLTPHLDPIAT